MGVTVLRYLPTKRGVFSSPASDENHSTGCRSVENRWLLRRESETMGLRARGTQ